MTSENRENQLDDLNVDAPSQLNISKDNLLSRNLNSKANF